MWVILLNGDTDTDAREWGIQGCLAAVGVREANGRTVCEKISHEKVDSVILLADASMLVVNDYVAREHEDKCERLLEKLRLGKQRVWIHFGTFNSDHPTFTRPKIHEKWKEATSLGRYRTLNTGPVNPFSMTSQTKWDRQLQSLAEALRTAFGNGASHSNELRRRIDELGKAWISADGYYDATQPFGAWIKVAFPLFLDAMGIELAKNKGIDTDNWYAEAFEAYRKARRRTITSDLRLSGEEGLLARAEEVLSTAQSKDHEELKLFFYDCKKAAEFLEQIDGQADSSALRPGNHAQKLLVLSVLLRRMEQHFSL